MTHIAKTEKKTKHHSDYHATSLYLFYSIFLLIVIRSMSFAARLAEKGITLPKVSTPVGNYVSILRTGNTLYLCVFFLFLMICSRGTSFKRRWNNV